MKKIFFYLLIGGLTFTSCNKNDDPIDEADVELDAPTQNSYDDEAIATFLEENYFDEKGNVKEFSETDSTDNHYPKLSTLNPVKLSSGVVYIVREGAQPINGEIIKPTDSLKMMVNAKTYKGVKDADNKYSLKFLLPFRNTMASGSFDIDPAYYYIVNEVLENANTAESKLRSFYEIEGFKEGLTNFKAFSKEDEEDYNLQGVIIVPSRAAFGKDPHYNFTGYAYKDRTFVFNFQVYKRFDRVKP